MNNARRKKISEIADKIMTLKEELEEVRDEEQEAYDNMPEAFQDGERGQAMESIIYNLEEVIESMETACDGLECYEEV